MNTIRRSCSAARWMAGGIGLAVASYAALASAAFFRYGHVPGPVTGGDADPLLDQFMREYEVVERHQVRIAAPSDITFAAARDQDLLRSPIVRAIFKTRELVLGSAPDDRRRPRALLAQVMSLGWGVLAEVPGREIVMGAVTKPWEANVVFRALPPADFAAFHEPGHVKIVWTLRADPSGTEESIFRTETRAMATDSRSRAKFRRYWSFVSPGVWMIRRLLLTPLKEEAERRALEARP